MTAERWFFDTNVVFYLFDEKSPKQSLVIVWAEMDFRLRCTMGQLLSKPII